MREFFESPKEQSKVKAAIVSKYFTAWANVILGQQNKQNRNAEPIQYVDLFAGPGRYDDTTQSTPLLVVDKAINDNILRSKLKLVFNDGNREYASSLIETINTLPNVKDLRYEPVIYNEVVDHKFVQLFGSSKMPPTLTFLDPFGYMGLSQQLINVVIKNWGCECIFFFNYNRINMGISNPFVESHMNSLFGKSRADTLRTKLSKLRPEERELTIVQAIADTMVELGGRYVLPFCFKNDEGVRTSHHLIFVSKHNLGYSIMKDIMAKESSDNNQGVPNFTYCPPTNKLEQMLLFNMSRPLDMLEELLLERFAGQTLTMKEIFNQHNVGTPYIKKNYKEILLKLEAEGKVTAEPSKRNVNTFGENVKVYFPKRSS